MNYEALRHRNKKILIEFAFNIFDKQLEDIEKNKEYWLEKILNGYDIKDLINQLKSGQLRLQTVEAESTQINSKIGRVLIDDHDLEFYAGQRRKLSIKVANDSENLFQTTSTEPLYAAYHWYNEDGSYYEFDGIRTPLPDPINPHNWQTFEIDVTTPKVPGRYMLMPTLIIEGEVWLEDRGLDVAIYSIEVSELKGASMTKRSEMIYNKLKSRLSDNTNDCEKIKRAG